MIYIIWLLDYEHENVNFVMAINEGGIDAARDMAKSLTLQERKPYDYALLGGELCKHYEKVAKDISDKREKIAKSIVDQEEKANKLLSEHPYLHLYVYVCKNEDTGCEYRMYDLFDIREVDMKYGIQSGYLFCGCESEYLVSAIKDELEKLRILSYGTRN